jgi:hypothetical protein
MEKRIVIAEDNFGSIYVEENRIYLAKKNSEKGSRLASFDLAEKTLIVNRDAFEKYSRFFYGINEVLLRKANKCDVVRLICPEGIFNIPIQDFLIRGKNLKKETGITAEIFYDIADMEKYKA